MTYQEAYTKAIELSRLCKRDVGISYNGNNDFYTHILPNYDNRYGFELRCEIVTPKSTITY
jgi:hypothetical protein